MRAARLPVSGLDVMLRAPTGAEDLLMAEAPPDFALAARLVEALARRLDGGAVDAWSLPLGDLDAVWLRLRQALIGEIVRAEVHCVAAECGEKFDIAFGVEDYLRHHAPRLPQGVSREGEALHYRLADPAIGFRIPTVRDWSETAALDDDGAALAGRCVERSAANGTVAAAATDVERSAANGTVAAAATDVEVQEPLEAEARRAVEEALEALAPSLYGELAGSCPSCGAEVSVAFDPQIYVLRELRARSLAVYEEVHLLASRYHWSEREILELPQQRRARYVELARGTA